MIEKKLKYQQVEVAGHERYFFNIIYSNRMMLVTTLLPAFLWGWKQARMKGAVLNIGKQFISYGLYAVATRLKKQLL